MQARDCTQLYAWASEYGWDFLYLKPLFFISSFKLYLCGSISYKLYVVKHMIRNSYRILVGNLKGSVRVADISLYMAIIIKYIFKKSGMKICLVISKW
jgi:hypothetical protein